MGRKLNDLTGLYFGRLIVTGLSHVSTDHRGYWNCVCICGQKKTVEGTALTGQRTISCGCLRREQVGRINFIHGESRTKLYGVWESMNRRCQDKKQRGYRTYGARGIRVCDEWRHDFLSFHDWAFSHGYAENLTIDRINNDDDYEPTNCQWLTRSVHNNKSWLERKEARKVS